MSTKYYQNMYRFSELRNIGFSNQKPLCAVTRNVEKTVVFYEVHTFSTIIYVSQALS